MGALPYRIFAVALVLGAFWFFRRDYFWPVALVSALVLAGVLLRQRHERHRSPGLLRRVGEVLGLRPTGRRWLTVSVADRDLVLRELDAREAPGGRPCLELELDLGDFWPFCFVLRSEASSLFGQPLGENLPIRGADFEYSLEPLPRDGLEDLEGATNMPGLLAEFLAGPVLDNVRVLGARGLPRLLQLEFNGYLLRSQWELEERFLRHSLRRIFARFVLLGVDLRELLGKVHFKNPT